MTKLGHKLEPHFHFQHRPEKDAFCCLALVSLRHHCHYRGRNQPITSYIKITIMKYRQQQQQQQQHKSSDASSSAGASVTSSYSGVSVTSGYRHTANGPFMPPTGSSSSPKQTLMEDAQHQPKTRGSFGVLVVGLGGANGTTLLAGILANRLHLEWRGPQGQLQTTPNYNGCITQLDQKGGGVGYRNVVKGLANANMAAVGGWVRSSILMYINDTGRMWRPCCTFRRLDLGLTHTFLLLFYSVRIHTHTHTSYTHTYYRIFDRPNQETPCWTRKFWITIWSDNCKTK